MNQNHKAILAILFVLAFACMAQFSLALVQIYKPNNEQSRLDVNSGKPRPMTTVEAYNKLEVGIAEKREISLADGNVLINSVSDGNFSYVKWASDWNYLGGTITAITMRYTAFGTGPAQGMTGYIWNGSNWQQCGVQLNPTGVRSVQCDVNTDVPYANYVDANHKFQMMLSHNRLSLPNQLDIDDWNLTITYTLEVFAPDVNITNPLYGWKSGLFDFNISAKDLDTSASLKCNVFRSPTPLAFSTLLTPSGGLDLNAQRCNGDTNFQDGANCGFVFNSQALGIPDGNFFLDLNCWDSSLLDDNSTTPNSIGFDNTAPTVSSTGTYNIWGSAQDINIGCSDATSGAANRYYKKDLDVSFNKTMPGAFTLFTTAVNFPQDTVDANYAFQKYCTDNAGNSSAVTEDYVLVLANPAQTMPLPLADWNFSSTRVWGDVNYIGGNLYVSASKSAFVFGNFYFGQQFQYSDAGLKDGINSISDKEKEELLKNIESISVSTYKLKEQPDAQVLGVIASDAGIPAICKGFDVDRNLATVNPTCLTYATIASFQKFKKDSDAQQALKDKQLSEANIRLDNALARIETLEKKQGIIEQTIIGLEKAIVALQEAVAKLQTSTGLG